MWVCLCECGNNSIVLGDLLNKSLRGKTGTKSCGCLRNNAHNKIEDRNFAMWKQLYNSTIIKRSKSKKWETDFDLDFFIEISSKPCNYCGDIGSNVTTDRIDESTTLRFNGIDRINSEKYYTK